jgi:uncharacterized coiled-coil DUF342 family protein
MSVSVYSHETDFKLCNYVSREKYDNLKEKATRWRSKALDYINLYQELHDENEKLQEENDEIQNNLQDKLLELTEIEKREFEYKEELLNLRNTCSEYREKIRNMRRKLRDIEKQQQEERLLEKLRKRVTN